MLIFKHILGNFVAANFAGFHNLIIPDIAGQ